MIHICIPVHNEASTIGILLWKIRKVMAEFGRDYEIAVLDDASSDETAQVLERYRRVLPLRILRSDTRLGIGGATERLLRDAVSRSRYPKRDVAVTIQGDFTESPEDLVAMVKAVEGGADLVVGQLEIRRNELPRSIRMGRWAARLLLGGAARGAPVQDLLSGYRAYRLVVLKKAFREVETPDVAGGDAAAGELSAPSASAGAWAANVALLARTAPHARRIDHTPYTLRLEPRSRATRLRVMDELKGLLPLRRPLRQVQWPTGSESSEAA